jgi:hypothetical protein
LLCGFARELSGSRDSVVLPVLRVVLSIVCRTILIQNNLGEKDNLAAEHPEIVEELAAMIKNIRDSGRTRK